ncbi:MAG: glycosyltransferase [Acidobacteriota bacterium]
MTRVLLVQPSLQPPGGGNGVAAWMLQALVPDHQVTVLTWWPVQLEPINRFFGTSLDAGDFRRLEVPGALRAIDRLPVPAALLRSSAFMRHTRRVAGGFDVVIGVNNETDFGRPGIQYIHYPTYLRPRPDADLRWYHRAPLVLPAYYALADRLAGFSEARMKANVTLVNSDWTGARVRQSLGIDTVTLYPPVADPGPAPAWGDRLPGFLAIGRISPEKELERPMRILAKVRRHVPQVTLTVVGTWDRHSRRYYEWLRRLAASLGPWITFRLDVPARELRSIIAAHRYGIHGMREEHFGMAPAEMVRAGLLVWVPNGGGQVEIVGSEPALVFDDEDEAVEKIARALTDVAEERRLRAWLAECGARFSTARFTDEVRRIVGEFAG